MAEASIVVIVEIPKGSRNKYEYDAELGAFRLDRVLFSSVHYPTDYGYVVGAQAEDGDPLDAMVMVDEATFPGCAIRSKPIAILKMRDEKGLDNKILCVPAGDPRWEHSRDMTDIPSYFTREIENFFAIYKELEGKKVQIEGWGGAKEAWQVVESSRERNRLQGTDASLKPPQALLPRD